MFTMLGLLAVVFIATEIKGFRYIGAGVNAVNTISVSADGDVFATPDTAYITFSQTSEGKTAADAQVALNTKIKAAVDAIKALGIDEKDIKTESLASNPKYDYSDGKPCGYGYCPPQTGKIVGYEATQSIKVKIKDTANTSKVVDALSKVGLTNVYGPEFGIDDMDVLQDQAREKAIAQAQAKAEKLAAELGVSLGRIVSFSENNGGPMFYRGGVMALDAKAESAPTAVIPTGENKITSNVTITYEIK